MNNLVLTKERIKKAQRLHAAQLAATKNGRLLSYRPSIFKKLQKQASEELASIES